MPLGTKGKRVFVSQCQPWCFLVRSLPLPQCVFYTSVDVASRTRSLSWPFERLVDAQMDSRGPHIPEGQSSRHLLSLMGCWAPPAWAFTGVISHWALPTTTSSLLCEEEMGVRSFFPRCAGFCVWLPQGCHLGLFTFVWVVLRVQWLLQLPRKPSEEGWDVSKGDRHGS